MAKELVDLFNISKQEIDGDLSHYKFTVAGAFGSGKSTFANALFNRIGSSVTFGFENRFKGIEGIRVIPIETWDDAMKYRTMLVKGFRENKGENPFDFNNIIFDPVGIAAKMCEDYVCKKNDWETLADGGYGKGYSVFEDKFNGYISSLQRLGFTISYVAHNRIDTVTPPRAADGYQVYVPDVNKRIRYAVQGEVDFIMYLDVVRQVDEETGINKPVRRLYLQNYADYELKVPVQGLPDYIEYDNVEDGVDQFIEAFNKAVNSDGKLEYKTEEKAPRKTAEDVLDTNEDDLSELIEQAVDVRQALLAEKSRDEVIDILTDYLGSPVIGDCDDKASLENFIEAYGLKA